MNYKGRKSPDEGRSLVNAWFFETVRKKTTNWMVISGSGDGQWADDIELAGVSFFGGLGTLPGNDYRGDGASSDFCH